MPIGNEYIVRRRASGEEILRTSDFRIGDVIVLLLHMCRNFPVEVECPEKIAKAPGKTMGYLWLPASEKPKLEAGIKENPTITWRFVCYDLFNTVECAFYRNEKLRLIDLNRVKTEYFTENVS